MKKKIEIPKNKIFLPSPGFELATSGLPLYIEFTST